jgi:hypothetical protein
LFTKFENITMFAKTFAAAVHGVDARIIEGKPLPMVSLSPGITIRHPLARDRMNPHYSSTRMSQFATTFKNPGYEK